VKYLGFSSLTFRGPGEWTVWQPARRNIDRASVHSRNPLFILISLFYESAIHSL
jgi:hypothetical protein